jgi:hypothetical protein
MVEREGFEPKYLWCGKRLNGAEKLADKIR